MRKPAGIRFLALTLICTACSTPPSSRIQDEGAGVIGFRCLPFDLDEVRLLEGPFLHATELNSQSLLKYEPDRLLAKFRTEAGLEPRAEHYHGWEDATIAGHSLGHYLSACALMYATTADTQFLDLVDYMVNELAACQAATGNGYIGAIPGGQRILEEEVARGEIRAAPFDLNGIWVPFYSMHKIMAGLRDAYHLCDNKEALEVERGLGDWLSGILAGLSEEQMQEILACEHGGINEVLADLYADTGDRAYLELSRRFHHRAILDPLSREEDILPGKHGNTQIPKLIGLARRYELTGDTTDRKTATFFWDRVVNHHSFVNGSHGNHEHFGPPDQLSNKLSSNTSESCNVYNMLKLSEHLFEWDASPEVADFYERALVNHILSSQHPEDGRVMYFHSLQMGGHKFYQDPNWFTCCVGTGMENHSQYGRAIFYRSEDELFISQFIAAELNWADRGLILRQVTGFPEEQGSTLEFKLEDPVKLTLRIRRPAWAARGYAVMVNGKKVRVREKPGSFLAIRRTWRDGDRVEVKMPFSLRLEPMPDNPDRVAICYGPLVMAADLGPADDPLAGDPLYVPGLVTDERDPEAWLIPDEKETNVFRTHDIGKPLDVTLRPLYRVHDRNYTVYFDLYSQEKWEAHLLDVETWQEERARLDSLTIDYVVPASGHETQDHHFRVERPGFYEFNGQNAVESRFGWFSWDLAVERGKPAGLVVEYWGGFLGPRGFEIRVNGEILATEDFSGLEENEHREIRYPIPANLTSRGVVTVRFDSGGDHFAGPVFSVRTVRTDATHP